MEIFKLFGSVLIDNDDANKSLAKTDKGAQSLGKRLGSGIKSAAKWAVGFGVAAGAVGVAMFAATKKVTDSFDNIAKSSTKLGVSTDAYQEMEYWASQNGIASNDMEKAVGRLNQRIGLAAEGNEKYSSALERLGVDMGAVKDGTVSTEEAMYQSISALSEMTNEQEKAALASELFGTKLGRELMPALQDGSLSLEDAARKAQELGIVIDGDVLASAETFNDTWDDLTRSATAFGQNIISYLMPVFQTMMDWVIGNMPQIQAFFSTAFEVIGNVITAVGGFIRDEVIARLIELYEWIAPHLPMIQEFFVQTFEFLVELLGGVVTAIEETTAWFKDHWAIVEPILIGIGAGVLAFQLITAAIAAYGLITKAITVVQLLFNGALLANPIGIVVVIIGALVAAGVLLYKNWDTVKAKLDQFWGKIKGVFSTMGTFISTTFNSIKKATTTAFNAVRDAIMKPINKARDTVKSAIDSIKGFFSGLSLKFPKIKMPKLPKFSLDGKFSLAPPSVPKLKINWNKLGGVFNTPTLFNTANAGLQGIGEAGSEAILPLNAKVLGGIGKGIASTMSNEKSHSSGSEKVEGLLVELIQAVREGKIIEVDGKTLGGIIDNDQGKRINLSGRVAY